MSPAVVNPVLELPGVRETIAALDPAQREALWKILQALRRECRRQEENAYARRKGPMTAYWMAVGTYAGHIARAMRQAVRLPNRRSLRCVNS